VYNRDTPPRELHVLYEMIICKRLLLADSQTFLLLDCYSVNCIGLCIGLRMGLIILLVN
jgi:hypothetical protein